MTSGKVILQRSPMFSRKVRYAPYLSGTITKKNSTIMDSAKLVPNNLILFAMESNFFKYFFIAQILSLFAI